MIYKTVGQILNKVRRETDTEVEDFIQPEEFIDYVQDAIDEAEAAIHRLGYEDEYFLTQSTLTFQQGEQEVSLPEDIYASKIRAIVYHKNNDIYEIKRVRGRLKFENVAFTNKYGTGIDQIRYMLVNRSAEEGVRVMLLPAPTTTTSDVTVWYIRNANTVTTLNDIVDLPEFYTFVYRYVKYRVLDKENGPSADIAKSELEEERQRMIETLTEQVPDGDAGEIERDFSFYEETF